MTMKMEILFYIFKLRGLSNEHLRLLIYGPEDNNAKAQKANISRFIVQLRKDGFVHSVVCLPFGGKLHFITDKGINCINENYEINPRHQYAGFDRIHGDFKEGVLRVRESELNKHMIFVEFAVNLIRSRYYVRNNFYCVKHYQIVENNESIAKKILPYGEFIKKLGEKPYVIELICATDDTAELVEKFKGYRNYIEFIKTHDKPIPFKGIYVLMDIQKQFPYENDFSWQKIINAALEGLGPYCYTTDIMGYNKPSLKELYNKDLLNHKWMQSAVIEEKLPFRHVSSDVQNKISSVIQKEKFEVIKKAEDNTENRVYVSKYTQYYDALLAEELRLAKEAVKKEQRGLEENQFHKKLIKGMKKLLKL